jgi:hypothetical protein
MKNKALNLRISERRLNKLRLYSAWKDKTMTQILEDFIDSLPTPEIDKNSDTLSLVLTFPVKSLSQAANPHRGRAILTNPSTVPGYQ